ncbi:MAG: hypothetical protein Q9219_002038 [cf. Caloplaca sp. 3 TL-2023]
MPADYNSTARALALPISPPDSPTHSHRQQPRWSRSGSTSFSRSQGSLSLPESSLRERVLLKMDRVGRATLRKFSPLQLALASVLGLAVVIGTILFFIYHETFFTWLEPTAVKWKNLRGGWCILWAMTFMTAFPPVVGYSTCFTLAGFVYGLPEGWLIIASATVAGSTCSFFTSRTIFSGFVHRLVANDRRFDAFSSVLKRDGLKLLIMIRLCPLPYSISNGAISTFPTVTPQMFVIATSIMTLKLIIPIFIGTRLAAIARNGGKKDATTNIINWISIIGGLILGLVTGWLIYKRTVARARELEAEERAQGGLRTREFSDEPEEHATTATLLRDDQIDFRDDHTSRTYRDEYTDDDDDVFRFGDGDEEEGIGLDKHTTRGH